MHQLEPYSNEPKSGNEDRQKPNAMLSRIPSLITVGSLKNRSSSTPHFNFFPNNLISPGSLISSVLSPYVPPQHAHQNDELPLTPTNTAVRPDYAIFETHYGSEFFGICVIRH
ncbi:hypothetical protein WDW89_11895 [Deltaproteobacteria bacterium TL4]